MPERKKNRVDLVVPYGSNNLIDYFEFINRYNEEYITVCEIKHRVKLIKLTLSTVVGG